MRADEPCDARAEKRLDQFGSPVRVVVMVVREGDVGDVVHEPRCSQLRIIGMGRSQVGAALERVRETVDIGFVVHAGAPREERQELVDGFGRSHLPIVTCRSGPRPRDRAGRC